MRDYVRLEVKSTVVRHGFVTPVNWVDVQKLLRIVLQELGKNEGAEPYDDELWYETDDDHLYLCYQLEGSRTSW